jgi:hypothetical protein
LHSGGQRVAVALTWLSTRRGDPFYFGLLRVVGAGHEPLFERKR